MRGDYFLLELCHYIKCLLLPVLFYQQNIFLSFLLAHGCLSKAWSFALDLNFILDCNIIALEQVDFLLGFGRGGTIKVVPECLVKLSCRNVAVFEHYAVDLVIAIGKHLFVVCDYLHVQFVVLISHCLSATL
jgi:hypothetical protein